MTRVDLLLDEGGGKSTTYECLIPDHLAVKGTKVEIKLGDENRHAEVYNVYQPLHEYKLV